MITTALINAWIVGSIPGTVPMKYRTRPATTKTATIQNRDISIEFSSVDLPEEASELDAMWGRKRGTIPHTTVIYRQTGFIRPRASPEDSGKTTSQRDGIAPSE
jgi:hypothetical protein